MFPLPTRDPLVSSIPPFEGTTIAQSAEIKSANQTPQAPIQLSNDFLSILLTAVLSGGAVWLAIAKFGEKFGDTVLANRKTQTDIIKSQSEIQLSEERIKLEQAQQLSNFYLETAKASATTLEKITMLSLTKNFDSFTQTQDQVYAQQGLLKDLIEQLSGLNKRQEKMERYTHDIFNVLKMKERDHE